MVAGTFRCLDSSVWAEAGTLIATVGAGDRAPVRRDQAEVDHVARRPADGQRADAVQVIEDAVRAEIGETGRSSRRRASGGEDFGWRLERSPAPWSGSAPGRRAPKLPASGARHRGCRAPRPAPAGRTRAAPRRTSSLRLPQRHGGPAPSPCPVNAGARRSARQSCAPARRSPRAGGCPGARPSRGAKPVTDPSGADRGDQLIHGRRRSPGSPARPAPGRRRSGHGHIPGA